MWAHETNTKVHKLKVSGSISWHRKKSACVNEAFSKKCFACSVRKEKHYIVSTKAFIKSVPVSIRRNLHLESSRNLTELK